MSAAILFAVVFGAFAVGHQVGDYWVQRGWQALGKGQPGWAGRRACAAHVAAYTLTLAAFLALAAWRLSLPVSPGWAAVGLAVNAVSHYLADRRTPLARLASAVGKGEYWRAGGAPDLDQAWHWGWLFITALITAGGLS
jgi:hypothetical protein